MGVSVSYTKLKDGSWGLRGTGLTAGEQVQVRKKDGSSKTEMVGSVLWSGTDSRTGEEVQLATIATKVRGGNGGSGGTRRRGGTYECDECGDYVSPGTRCWETGCIH